MISLIAAIGKNNELGKYNELIWIFPEDQKHFREITSGHTVIMGRKTFESIGRPLPKRRNIVITRDRNLAIPGIEIAHSLDGALSFAREDRGNQDEVFIIGGAEIYKQAIQLADKLYITHIDAEDKEADTFFPEIDENKWLEISKEEHTGDDKNPFPYLFTEYKKI